MQIAKLRAILIVKLLVDDLITLRHLLVKCGQELKGCAVPGSTVARSLTAAQARRLVGECTGWQRRTRRRNAHLESHHTCSGDGSKHPRAVVIVALCPVGQIWTAQLSVTRGME
tara:strand:- start:180 stop:521 length:342 start_codon:yes stop_codon:yes gene_type:complete